MNDFAHVKQKQCTCWEQKPRHLSSLQALTNNIYIPIFCGCNNFTFCLSFNSIFIWPPKVGEQNVNQKKMFWEKRPFMYSTIGRRYRVCGHMLQRIEMRFFTSHSTFNQPSLALKMISCDENASNFYTDGTLTEHVCKSINTPVKWQLYQKQVQGKSSFSIRINNVKVSLLVAFIYWKATGRQFVSSIDV